MGLLVLCVHSIYLFIYYENRTKVHMKRLKNKTTSYDPTTHTSNR